MGPAFNEREEEETDYGRLYYATPSRVYEPTSIEELASTLQQLNNEGTPVTIRNTGHSMNGQTLTTGVQVRVGKIKGIRFLEDIQEVEAHSGDSWDEILKAVRFPEWCPPVFPNNPGQTIHMSGTMSVGGMGFYSSSRGGLWNHVTHISLVTMEGRVFECSRSENSDLFRYALAGSGRIGVIAKFRVRVERSKKYVVDGAMVFHSADAFMSSLTRMRDCDELYHLCYQFQLSHQSILDLPGAFPYRIGFGYEAENQEEAHEIADRIRPLLGHTLHFYGSVVSEKPLMVTPSLSPVLSEKHSAVYVYPEEEPEKGELSHLWHDYILPESKFLEFLERARYEIIKRDLARTFLKQPFFGKRMHTDMCGGFLIRKMSNFSFPLTSDLSSGATGYHLSIDHEATRDDIPSILEVIENLGDACYQMGGKKYLYGTHSLTREQVEKQYGRETLDTWKRIKSQTDPKGLMNRGVIPHLDD